MFLSHLLHLEVAARVTGFVCGIVVLEFADQPWSHAMDRTLETVLGIGVAYLVSLVPKLIGVEEPGDAIPEGLLRPVLARPDPGFGPAGDRPMRYDRAMRTDTFETGASARFAPSAVAAVAR